jgi:hypothetical protein
MSMKNGHKISGLQTACLLLWMIAAAYPGVSAGSDAQTEFKEYVSTGGYFKCVIPEGWSIYHPGFGLSDEDKKIYGLTLFGYEKGGMVRPTLSIHYYAPGNLMYGAAEKYIRLHAAPVFGVTGEGKWYGEVRKVTLAGRDARAFERKDVRYVGERALNPVKAFLYEEFRVVPALDNKGFYALKMSAPFDSRGRYAALFDTVVKSFRPGP